MLDDFKKNMKRKGFVIDLEDRYSLPKEKDFVYPSELVIQGALENYCQKMGLTLEYISREKPVTFVLDGGTKYTAEANLGTYGYYVHCLEVLEEFAEE